MSETVEIEVEDEATAREIGYAIMGRAVELNRQPDSAQSDDMARRLREIGRHIIKKYEP